MREQIILLCNCLVATGEILYNKAKEEQTNRKGIKQHIF